MTCIPTILETDKTTEHEPQDDCRGRGEGEQQAEDYIFSKDSCQISISERLRLETIYKPRVGMRQNNSHIKTSVEEPFYTMKQFSWKALVQHTDGYSRWQQRRIINEYGIYESKLNVRRVVSNMQYKMWETEAW